jgi:hypothetical protein
LKTLKADLKKWSDEVFGDVGKKRNELLEGIQELVIIEEWYCLVVEELVRKEKCRGSWRKLSFLRKWTGDRNHELCGWRMWTKTQIFFHRVANSHRKFNHVDSLNINGALSKTPMEIKEQHIVHFYNSLYFEQCSWRPRVNGLSFLSIDVDESTWLEREFKENEMWDVVRDLNGDKALGLDGFTMAFF